MSRRFLIVKFITLDSWNFIGGAKDVKSPKLLSTPTHMEKKLNACLWFLEALYQYFETYCPSVRGSDRRSGPIWSYCEHVLNLEKSFFYSYTRWKKTNRIVMISMKHSTKIVKIYGLWVRGGY